MQKLIILIGVTSIFLFGCGKPREQIKAEKAVQELESENYELQEKISELEKELEKSKAEANFRENNNSISSLREDPQEEHIYGESGVTYNKVGNYFYGSDGKTYSKVGNALMGTDGSYCYKLGNTYTCNK